jgi:hypothetical protein
MLPHTDFKPTSMLWVHKSKEIIQRLKEKHNPQNTTCTWRKLEDLATQTQLK